MPAYVTKSLTSGTELLWGGEAGGGPGGEEEVVVQEVLEEGLVEEGVAGVEGLDFREEGGHGGEVEHKGG